MFITEKLMSVVKIPPGGKSLKVPLRAEMMVILERCKEKKTNWNNLGVVPSRVDDRKSLFRLKCFPN